MAIEVKAHITCCVNGGIVQLIANVKTLEQVAYLGHN